MTKINISPLDIRFFIKEKINMKIKTSIWTLIAAILFTINTIYFYLKYPEDTVGVIIFSIATICFYIATIGNWKSGN
jgi:hypothetical protein